MKMNGILVNTMLDFYQVLGLNLVGEYDDNAHAAAHDEPVAADAEDTESSAIGVKRPRIEVTKLDTREEQYNNLRKWYKLSDRSTHWFKGDEKN